VTEIAPPLDAYLDRLEEAAAVLPADRREELLADVREHVTLAQSEAVPIEEVLARLGEPEAIVAAELTETGEAVTADEPPRERPPLSAEAKALLLLTVGAVVLPFVGPLLGLWVASGSTRWSLSQKRTAVLIVLVLLVPPAVTLLPMAVAGELTWLVTTGGILLPLVPLAGILAAIYLVVSSSVIVTVSRRRA
jgi:HAAS domain-containing protein